MNKVHGNLPRLVGGTGLGFGLSLAGKARSAFARWVPKMLTLVDWCQLRFLGIAL